MPDVILALDMATATGAAHDGPHPGCPVLSTFRAPPARGDDRNGWDYSATFGGFRSWLLGLARVVKPTLIAFEAPLVAMGGNVYTRHMTVRILYGLPAITEEVAYQLDIPTAEINVQKVKAHFAGSGRAKKEAMMARCQQLRWPAKNHNEADAAAVWSYAKSLRDRAWAPTATPLFRSAAL